MTRGIIMGAGAIGSLIGALLSQKKGKEVLLVAKRNQCNKVESKGLALSGLAEGVYQPKIQDHLKEIPEKSILLVTTKAVDLEETLTKILPLIKSDTIVVPIQKGLGVTEMANKILKNRCLILRGLSFLSASYFEPGKVIYEGGNTLKIEEAKGDTEILHFFHNTPIVVDKVKDIDKEVLIQTILYSIIDPLTALEHITVGELNQKKYFDVIDGLLREGVKIADLQGVTLEASELWKVLKKIFFKLNTARTAMYQDLILGRSTEIEFLNGALLRHGNCANIPMPYNTFIYEAIKLREEKQLKVG